MFYFAVEKNLYQFKYWYLPNNFLEYICAFMHREKKIYSVLKKLRKSDAKEIFDLFLSEKEDKVKLSNLIKSPIPEEGSLRVEQVMTPLSDTVYMALWPIIQYIEKQLSKRENIKAGEGILILVNILYNSKYKDRLQKECNIDFKKYVKNLEKKHKLTKKEQTIADFLFGLCSWYKNCTDIWTKIYNIFTNYHWVIEQYNLIIKDKKNNISMDDSIKSFKPYITDSPVDPYKMLQDFETTLANTFSLGYNFYNLRYLLNCGTGGATHKYTKMDSAQDLLKTLYNKYKDENISADYVFSKMSIEYNQPDYLLWTLDSIPQDDTIKKWIKKWDKENGINRKGFKRKAKGKHS